MTEIRERSEMILPGPAQALASLLDVPLPDLDGDEGLPLLWHWIYLLDRPAQRDLGDDGHPVRGSIPQPPGPQRRRMWAGGEVRSLHPLRTGEVATRRTQVLSIEEKQGRSGALTFVAVGHEISQRGQVVVQERHDIVYRDRAQSPPAESTPGDVPHPLRSDEWAIDITPTLLFRYSALTYNAHRIHYDRDYCREVEGYGGLLTHGPLQALAMTEAARIRRMTVTPGLSCTYRLIAPLFDHQGLIARAAADDDGVHASVRDHWGRQTAHARIAGETGPAAV
jgi:3-methylfumaryl-CoA hydratase